MDSYLEKDVDISTVVRKICSLENETAGLLEAFYQRLGSEGTLAAKKMPLCIKRLSDGMDESDYGYEEVFTKGEIGRASQKLVFERLFIDKKMEEYAEPLLLISDEYEIDKNVENRIQARRSRGYRMFPVIILPDDFFIPTQGEVFGYIQLLETLETACECKPMAFKRGDICSGSPYVKGYVGYLFVAVGIERAIAAKDEIQRFLSGAIDYLKKEGNDSSASAVRRLAACGKIEAYCQRWRDLERESQQFENKRSEAEALLGELREQYDRHIAEIMKYEPEKKKTPIQVRMALKYGDMKRRIDDFLEEMRQSELSEKDDRLSKKTGELIKNTKADLSSKASELTLAGTFSSGKTTMINALLDHAHKLHTSKGHNTAALMQIKRKEADAPEEYEVVWKEHLVWNLLKPQYTENDRIRNPFPGRAKVIQIQETADAYSIEIKSLEGKGEKQTIKVGKTHELCVSEKNVLDKNAPLIKVKSDAQYLRMVTRDELNLLIEYIEDGRLCHPKVICMEGMRPHPTDVILSGLKAKKSEREGAPKTGLADGDALEFLKTLSSHERYKDGKGNIRGMTSAVEIRDLMKREIREAIFEADIALKAQRVILDEAGWQNFCGEAEERLAYTQQKKTIPFCEAPECYMLADHINLYLGSGFLDYCELNDTPGFGSITEEHDACAERFLNGNRGRLLVMITISSKTEDEKLHDFLNYLDGIFSNRREEQRDEVFFLFNCFSNNAPERKLKKDVEALTQKIVSRGFRKKNIFACDLRKVTEGHQAPREMYGLPSYAVFKDRCLHALLETGLRKKYRSVYESWKTYFEENRFDLNRRRKEAEGNLQDGEKRLAEYEDRLKSVKKVDEPTLDTLLCTVRREYTDFYDGIESVFRTTRKKDRKEACDNQIKEIETRLKDLQKSEDIGKAVRRKIHAIELAGNYDSQDGELPKPDTEIFTLALQALQRRVWEADKKVRFLKKEERTAFYMRWIKGLIEEDYKQSEKRAREYLAKLNPFFLEKKNNIIRNLEEQIHGIQNSEELERQIKECDELLKKLEEYYEKFRKLEWYFQETCKA